MNVNGGNLLMSPYPEGMVSVAEEFNPSKEGVLSCLHDDPNFGEFLDLIESAGGKGFKFRTVITKEIGYWADFMNTQGDMVSLHLYA